MADAILIAPRAEKGRGGGHLVRCAALCNVLRACGRKAFLYTNKKNNSELKEFVSSTLALAENFDPKWIVLYPPEKISLVIIDGFRTSKEEFEMWRGRAPVLGIDEGGKERDGFDFLIDLLPGIYRPSAANLKAPGFLALPENRRPDFFLNRDRARILISFGAEDYAGLGFHAAQTLSKLNGAEIILLGRAVNVKGVSHIEKIKDLREHLAEYDLLITHYGLSAFEALRARLPVILVAPGPYHEKLARSAGFFSAGTGKRAARRLGRILTETGDKKEKPALNKKFLENLAARYKALADIYSPEETKKLILETDSLRAGELSLGDYLSSSAPLVSGGCRASCCGRGSLLKKKPGPVIARFPDRTYRRCGNCGLIGMDRLRKPPVEYDKDYFFDSYKKQYGKTYLEDFPNIMKAGTERLKHIKAILEKPEKKAGTKSESRGRLLDIGCAYGPFLAAAKAEGFEAEGVEPAEDAANYVKEKLGLPCRRGFFPDAVKDEKNAKAGAVYGAVTLWYVIEHFENPGTVLEEINRVLKPGGVLAFSTPSCSGISGRKSLRVFLKNSPADHWTVWRPGICKKLVKKYGFTLKKIVVTGHHPERFHPAGKRLKRGGFFFSLLAFLSRLFRLGDSFEVYAIKD